MKLSTGKKPFVIEFDTGDKETIYFNPNDPDLAERIYSLSDRIENKVKDLKDIEVGVDGEPISEKDIEAYAKIKGVVYGEIDKTFDYPVCEKVFKHCSAFASVGGRLFVEHFLESIAPEIEKEVKKERGKMDKHIGEFLKK